MTTMSDNTTPPIGTRVELHNWSDEVDGLRGTMVERPEGSIWPGGYLRLDPCDNVTRHFGENGKPVPVKGGEVIALTDEKPDAPIVPELDPSDPFDAVLIKIVETNRRKRQDYTGEGTSPWSNFDEVEAQTGYGFGSATETLIATKQARLKALQTRGEPVNESTEDTLLDRAVYCIIAYARSQHPDGKVQ